LVFTATVSVQVAPVFSDLRTACAPRKSAGKNPHDIRAIAALKQECSRINSQRITVKWGFCSDEQINLAEDQICACGIKKPKLRLKFRLF
jgi:hypothetical protein